jgi:hypothetical protein
MKIWSNIWYWRIMALIGFLLFISLFLYVWFNVLPDYERMYNALEKLGYL